MSPDPGLGSADGVRHFDFQQRVVIRATERTRANGTAGWHGTVVGKSYEDDEPAGRLLAYAVTMDEAAKKSWMVEPEDLEAVER